MYRRQLGGTNAALNRAKQRIRDLEHENAELTAIGARYRRICEEHGLLGKGDDLTALYTNGLTPAQAVEATLGRETCSNKLNKGGFWCSKCDCAVDGFTDVSGMLCYVRYCPNCGRKVER